MEVKLTHLFLLCSILISATLFNSLLVTRWCLVDITCFQQSNLNKPISFLIARAVSHSRPILMIK